MQQIHRAVSDDGTQIAGSVHGEGPPLVLLHGALYDGETNWSGMLPYLTDRFTCFLPSFRGRGLSADDPDHSPARYVQDVTAFVESIGEPVSLAGWSAGGMFALGAAAQSSAISDVMAWEPAVFEVVDDDTATRFSTSVGRVAAEAQHGRLLEAAEILQELVATGEEMRAILDAGWLARCALNVQPDLRMLGAIDTNPGPSPTEPGVLASITVPVLLLHGDRPALTWFAEGVDHIVEHVADCHVRVVSGVGHAAPIVMPEVVAAELVGWLAPRGQPV